MFSQVLITAILLFMLMILQANSATGGVKTEHPSGLDSTDGALHWRVLSSRLGGVVTRSTNVCSRWLPAKALSDARTPTAIKGHSSCSSSFIVRWPGPSLDESAQNSKVFDRVNLPSWLSESAFWL